MILETNSPQETFSAGRQLGEKAFPGQVITLTGDLGVGKTVFTQGLAKGLGIEEPVNSPTFTIVQVYDEGRLPLYHFDVYRIGDIEEMDEVGFEEYVMGDGFADRMGESDRRDSSGKPDGSYHRKRLGKRV